jgi:hypothetical protein
VSRRRLRSLKSSLLLTISGCGAPASELLPLDAVPLSSFAVDVVDFSPGAGAGWRQERLPEVVLGPPHGGATHSGNTDDVLSLGQGGSIVLELGIPIVDSDGPDLVVFENPFLIAGNGGVFAEPAEVSVSVDGEAWHRFPCRHGEGGFPGCAGLSPVLASPDNGIDPTRPPDCGGDLFDLAHLDTPLEGDAWFVRIVDRGSIAVAPTAGFDLDAVAVIGDPAGAW